MDEKTCDRCKWWKAWTVYGPYYCYSRDASIAMGHRQAGMRPTKANFGCRFWEAKADEKEKA